MAKDVNEKCSAAVTKSMLFMSAYVVGYLSLIFSLFAFSLTV